MSVDAVSVNFTPTGTLVADTCGGTRTMPITVGSSASVYCQIPASVIVVDATAPVATSQDQYGNGLLTIVTS